MTTRAGAACSRSVTVVLGPKVFLVMAVVRAGWDARVTHLIRPFAIRMMPSRLCMWGADCVSAATLGL